MGTPLLKKHSSYWKRLNWQHERIRQKKTSRKLIETKKTILEQPFFWIKRLFPQKEERKKTIFKTKILFLFFWTANIVPRTKIAECLEAKSCKQTKKSCKRKKKIWNKIFIQLTVVASLKNYSCQLKRGGSSLMSKLKNWKKKFRLKNLEWGGRCSDISSKDTLSKRLLELWNRKDLIRSILRWKNNL